MRSMCLLRVCRTIVGRAMRKPISATMTAASDQRRMLRVRRSMVASLGARVVKIAWSEKGTEVIKRPEKRPEAICPASSGSPESGGSESRASLILEPAPDRRGVLASETVSPFRGAEGHTAPRRSSAQQGVVAKSMPHQENVMKHPAVAVFLAVCFAMTTCPVLAGMPRVPGSGQSEMPARRGLDSASMQTMQIPSHGALMNALVYVAAGAGPHPVVILLHGFPGNERNLDLAQDMRRAGWDVLYFNYRGSWGTPGDFSFTHGIEDTAAAIAYLRQPGVARSLRLDPHRIVLIGHSMGGFMTVEAAAADPAIKAFATISAADMSGRMQALLEKEKRADAIAAMAHGLAEEGMAPLAGCTPAGLANELADHATSWPFTDKVDALKNRNALILTADDGLTRENDAFAAALRKAGDTHVITQHFATDHAYSDKRIELSQAVLRWLAGLPK